MLEVAPVRYDSGLLRINVNVDSACIAALVPRSIQRLPSCIESIL